MLAYCNSALIWKQRCDRFAHKKDASSSNTNMHIAAAIAEPGLHITKICKSVPGIGVALLCAAFGDGWSRVDDSSDRSARVDDSSDSIQVAVGVAGAAAGANAGANAAAGVAGAAPVLELELL